MRYKIDVSIDTESQDSMRDEEYSLYAFKAVESSNKAGLPTVWFAEDEFLEKVDITWEEQYRAYIAHNDAIAEGTISTHTDRDIDLNQTMNVDEHGHCEVVRDGVGGSITVNNQGTKPYTTGISSLVDGGFSTLCAFPLHGKNADIMVPKEKVLLMFSRSTIETKTVIERSLGSGLLIDLTGVKNRSVSFHIDKGWNWGAKKETWGVEIPANSELNPLLIEFSDDLQKRANGL
jgi:hypothetical protein